MVYSLFLLTFNLLVDIAYALGRPADRRDARQAAGRMTRHVRAPTTPTPSRPHAAKSARQKSSAAGRRAARRCRAADAWAHGAADARRVDRSAACILLGDRLLLHR